MRCHKCDYCEGEAGSSYYSSVQEYKGNRTRKVILDRNTMKETCTYCLTYPEKEPARG